MQTHRVWIAATFVWLFTLFNIERIYEPVNLASFVYAFVTLGGVLMLIVRRLRETTLAWSIAAALVAFLVTKCVLGYSISIEDLPITLTEAAAIAGTMFLARRIGRNSDAFAESTAKLLQTMRGRSVPALGEVEPEMQREMRRARRYGRPLAIVTVRPREESLDTSLHRFVEQLEHDLIQRYAVGRLADLLLSETKSNDVIAWDGEHFVVMLPETERQQATQMLQRVNDRIGATLGLQVDTGLADFPDDELTFSGLVTTASLNADRCGGSRDGAAGRTAADLHTAAM